MPEIGALPLWAGNKWIRFLLSVAVRFLYNFLHAFSYSWRILFPAVHSAGNDFRWGGDGGKCFDQSVCFFFVTYTTLAPFSVSRNEIDINYVRITKIEITQSS